ncbi:MAG: MJ0042-type zinc finger domain-containing protein [Vicinamibacterales bacterium]
MSRYPDTSRSRQVDEAPPPEKCPSCGSASIVTTGKIPTADSYWRCDACGEVWNAARRSSTPPRKPGHANSRYWT